MHADDDRDVLTMEDRPCFYFLTLSPVFMTLHFSLW